MYFKILTICLLVELHVSLGQEFPNKCLLDRDVGPCKASMQRYYFNSKTKKCEKFIYGGCKGNDNRFLSLYQCLSNCSPTIARSGKPNKVNYRIYKYGDFSSKITLRKKCLLAPDIGPCKGRFERFYYNSRTKSCEKFIYGGCRGNENNFNTLFDCGKQCS